jgi:hypothetical protein
MRRLRRENRDTRIGPPTDGCVEGRKPWINERATAPNAYPPNHMRRRSKADVRLAVVEAQAGPTRRYRHADSRDFVAGIPRPVRSNSASGCSRKLPLAAARSVSRLVAGFPRIFSALGLLHVAWALTDERSLTSRGSAASGDRRKRQRRRNKMTKQRPRPATQLFHSTKECQLGDHLAKSLQLEHIWAKSTK